MVFHFCNYFLCQYCAIIPLFGKNKLELQSVRPLWYLQIQNSKTWIFGPIHTNIKLISIFLKEIDWSNVNWDLLWMGFKCLLDASSIFDLPHLPKGSCSRFFLILSTSSMGSWILVQTCCITSPNTSTHLFSVFVSLSLCIPDKLSSDQWVS